MFLLLTFKHNYGKANESLNFENKEIAMAKRNIFVIAGIVAVFLVGGLFLSNKSVEASPCPATRPDVVLNQGEAHVWVGSQAPDFFSCNQQGGLVKLSDYAGQHVFLNFWASWCEPCRYEMPSMQKVHEQYGGRLTMLALDVLDDEASARHFFEKEYAFTYTFLFDKYNDGARTYYIISVPQTFLISPDGKIAAIILGARNWESAGCMKLLDAFINDQKLARSLVNGC